MSKSIKNTFRCQRDSVDALSVVRSCDRVAVQAVRGCALRYYQILSIKQTKRLIKLLQSYVDAADD